MKFIRGTRTREELILCTGLRADQTFRMASQQKTDERMIAACSDELVAKEAYCLRTSYQSFARDFLSNRNTEEHSANKSGAFEKVTIYLSNLLENPGIVELSKFTGILEFNCK